MFRYCPTFSVLTIVCSSYFRFGCAQGSSALTKILPKSISLCKTTAITSHIVLHVCASFKCNTTLRNGLEIQAFKQRLHKKVTFLTQILFYVK